MILFLWFWNLFILPDSSKYQQVLTQSNHNKYTFLDISPEFGSQQLNKVNLMFLLSFLPHFPLILALIVSLHQRNKFLWEHKSKLLVYCWPHNDNLLVVSTAFNKKISFGWRSVISDFQGLICFLLYNKTKMIHQLSSVWAAFQINAHLTFPF